MKKNIHPKYYKNAKVICACGNIFETGSTTPELKVEFCSVCHPFFTGKQKLVDSARRVEKFEAKMKIKKEMAKTRKGKKIKKAIRNKANKNAKKEITIKIKPPKNKKN